MCVRVCVCVCVCVCERERKENGCLTALARSPGKVVPVVFEFARLVSHNTQQCCSLPYRLDLVVLEAIVDKAESL